MDNSPRKQKGMDTLDCLITLAQYSRMIILATVSVMTLTYLVLFLLPDKYTTTARILPPTHNFSLSGYLLNALGGGIHPGYASGRSGIGMSVVGFLGYKEPGDLYVYMMAGDTISDSVINRFDLYQVFKVKFMEDARKALKKMCKIQHGKKNGLISIEVTDTDPQRAAEIANAYVEELDNLLRRLVVQEAASRLTFLERERVKSVEKLRKVEEALRDFKEKTNVIQIDAQTRGMLDYISSLRAKIDAHEVLLQVIRQQATSNNYDVVRLETIIKGLKHKVQLAEKQYDQDCIGGVCLPVSKMPNLDLEYLRLIQELKFQQNFYELFVKLVAIARLDLVRDVAIIQVLDRAQPPEKTSNKRFLKTILAGIIMFFLMIFVAFTRDFWQQARYKQKNADRLELLALNIKPWMSLFSLIPRKRS